MKILRYYNTLFNFRDPQITEIVYFVRFYIAIFLFAVIGISLHAQAPQAINYQAVCRDTNGTPLAQQVVTYRASVLQGSPSGSVVYRETHTDTTNVYGISTLKIGRGTPVQGTFSSIPWGSGSYYLSIEMDPAGGSNYRNLGAPELLSVPYALQSKDGIAKGTITNQLMFWNGTAWDTLNPGSSGQMLTMCNGILIWGNCPGTITGLSCSTAVHTDTLIAGLVATNVFSEIAYTGGNGGLYSAQTIASTGVTGLTAYLNSGYFANGSDTLTLTITGTPQGSGAANFTINLGGHSCILTRVVDPGLISGLSCSTAVNSGTLTETILASGVSTSVSYLGGNGGTYLAQSINSTGVTGLIASIASGTFALGGGSVIYTISGTPAVNGTATFVITLGGQSCTITRSVNSLWRPGMVHCGSSSRIVPVVNPITNKIWMDRNLGASQVATNATDTNAFGDFYQWGRFGDGHQCRNSSMISSASSSDMPGHSHFITNVGDWRSPSNDNLWQGLS
jgi:hypothetical protein